MPHKHTRKVGGGADAVAYNLPPTTLARPLPVREQGKGGRDVGTKHRRASKPATTGYSEDDTPRAFARLMQMQTAKKPLSGLDDGAPRKNKKRKIGQDASIQPAPPAKPQAESAKEVPKILPGERIADFAARVDQALPVAGLARKGKGGERQTKTEKRLQKMYAEWRKDEARRRDKAEEDAERQEEEEDERTAEMGSQAVQQVPPTSRKKKRAIGEQADDAEDPWEVLKSRREAPKGLHDLVQAPPTFTNVPREKFKMRNGAGVQIANVPGAAGSLKRREELGEARSEIIKSYREMMGRTTA